jgi:putative RNA 2'-phosphotransferase
LASRAYFRNIYLIKEKDYRMNDRIVRASKFMSLVLRHQPEKIGIELDANGWTSVADLIARSHNGSVRLSAELIQEVVVTNDKKRFVISEDGLRIRAAQGHSVEVDLDLAARQPPDFLFHGTAARNMESIRESGLLKGRRHHVHLSLDRETAVRVGQRYGKPVVLTVQSRKMWDAGIPFYCSDNGVWLTEFVDSKYLQFSDED